MKSSLKFVLACCVVLATASCGDSDKSAKTNTVSDGKNTLSDTDQTVVAKVNGQPINQRQLDRSIASMNQNQRPQQNQQSKDIPPESKAAMEKNALKMLINQELLYQECKTKNLVVSNEEVDNTLKQVKSRMPNEEMFQKMLEQTHSSQEELKDDILRNLSIKRLIDQEILTKVAVTEEEKSTFYKESKDKLKQPESVRASHILIKLKKDATPEETTAAKTKIDKIKELVDKGGDFAELAKKNSDCPSSQKGGDLGFFTRGKMVPEFEKCAFGLKKPEEVSEVIKTPFGYHILKLKEKRAPGTVPYEEVKNDIGKHLKNRKMGKELEKYVDNLYSKANVESQIDL